MNNTNNIFFALLRSALKNQPLTKQEKKQFNIETLPEIYKLSSKHDLAHLVSVAIEKNELLCADNQYLKQFQLKQLKAVFRYEKLNYELNRICNAFEKENIPYILLKGSVIRKLYPEPWMRTSCDIDVLVHREDFAKAKELLVSGCGYVFHSETTHDQGFIAPNGTHVELHYTLIEENTVNGISQILNNVWNCATLVPETSCKYKMTEEMFFFYHIAHMAKHVKNGGCGVRPFLDLWLMQKEKPQLNQQTEQMLEKAQIQQFAKSAIKLSQNWFENASLEEDGALLQSYVLSGGVYGNVENRVALNQRKKGKIGYLISRIFASKSNLEKLYPSQKISAWLIPFYQVRRWVNLCAKNRRENVLKELKISSTVTEQQVSDAGKLRKYFE